MNHLSRLAGALALSMLTVSAADAATKVKVALFDMSAAAPFGVSGPGPGAGGFGMMGRGGMMGGGMMGWGPGPGGGMMMNGMMSVRADTTTVAAGQVDFDVTNWSRSIVHEMLVVAVDAPDAPLPYDYTNQIVVENQIKSLGETSELPPNSSEVLSLDLPAGNYLLICNVAGHYAAGMVLPFTVTP
jgi:uncharacterized cupredoxin-like copper-binding protein